MSELFTGPALFVAALSIVFLLVPLLYLLMALHERRLFDRFIR